MENYQFLIVGQGLAGSILAYTLSKRGQKVLVVDAADTNTCSQVAAGLVNPITGSKMTKTWRADDIFPFLHHFYREMENTMQARFFHQLPIYRPFDSIEQQNNWLAAATDPKFAPFVQEINQEQHQNYSEFVKNDFGGIETKQSGFLDTNAMLNACQTYFVANQMYVKSIFADEDLSIDYQGIRWKNITAQRIIFCRGKDDANSAWWQWLPFRLVKGEILKIKIEQAALLETRVVNRGAWIVPQGNSIFKAGSTYEWKDLSPYPTEKARLDIENNIKALLKTDFQTIEQAAGVRPATADRRLFIGQHPIHNNLLIFNGLGTKGVSLAPYFANHFVDFLIHQQTLNADIDVQRFYKNLIVAN